MTSLHIEILDELRKGMLPHLRVFKDRFYLAGGTGLALQIGHRESIDFDFFSASSFDTSALFAECEDAFKKHSLVKIQDEKDTLSILVDNAVAISFMGFPYPLVEPLIETPDMNLASIADIGCMKLSAITSRATMKDYADIFFILRTIPLFDLLAYADRKFPQIDQNLILKSLTYFEDVTDTALRFTVDNHISLETVQKALKKAVKEFAR